MRIGKKGTRRGTGAVVSVYTIAAAFAATFALACGGERAASKVSDTASAKSTVGDTAAATGKTATGARRARVIILGTSLTAGYGLDPSESYPTLLQQLADSARFNVTVVNAGLSGETSAGALRRASWILDQPADAIVLEVGANDGLRGVNPADTQKNIEALVDTILMKHKAMRIVLVQMEAPPNFGSDYTTRFHNAYGTAAKNKNIELLPFLLDSVAGVSALNQGDGVHPNRNGSRIVARNMFKALTPLFTTLSAGVPAASN